MANLDVLGRLLRSLREKAGISMQEAALGLSIDRSYLSKVENGKEKPSMEFLNKINALYSPDQAYFTHLQELSGYRKNIKHSTRKEEQTVNDDKQKIDAPQEIQVDIPQDMNILYCDSVFITSSQYGVILSFSQPTSAPNKQKVVCRIGMSKTHSRALIKALSDNLEMSEKASLPTKKFVA